jgi:3-hydroxyacyl-[acyl-carrier-protein] dehydratase
MPTPTPYDPGLVQKILPHRSPFLFVDSVETCEAGVGLTAVKKLDPAAGYFKGHFPGRPMMPGVLVAEALAQAGGLLIGLTYGEKMNFQLFLAQVDLKFIQPALPGEVLELKVDLKKTYGNLFRLAAKASVGSRVVAKGSLVLSREPGDG